MAKSKTIVTVVCTILICFLMLTFCVSLFGCSLDRNADYFDMKNFVGEYIKENANFPERDIFTIHIYTRTNDSRGLIAFVGSKIVNGNLVLTNYAAKNNSEDNIVRTDTLDANVVAMILYFTKVFDGNCVVTETEFKFLATGTTMKIVRNEYVGTRRFPTDVVPVRLIDVYDESEQVTLSLRLNTSCYSKEENKVIERDTYFNFATNCISVKGSDDVDYEVEIASRYYIKEK